MDEEICPDQCDFHDDICEECCEKGDAGIPFCLGPPAKPPCPANCSVPDVGPTDPPTMAPTYSNPSCMDKASGSGVMGQVRLCIRVKTRELPNV